MLTQQRKQLILDTLHRDGRIIAADLSASLGLSEDTIRRDLRALAARGLLQRVHGGALPASPAVANFAARSQLQMAGKQAIAAAAAAMVQPGQVLFIDGGTTCQQLALRLPHSLQATVVTHSPTIALALVEHPLIEVQLVGGRLFKHSVVAVGAAAIEAIRQVRADLYFMGVTGISATAGLSTGDMEEAHVKRALMAQAAETWVLASAEKLHAASPYVIAACNAATGLVVEPGTREQDVAPLRALGLALLRG
ncbi:DeoR/GlpR family DNA-binding transcription regulator [Rhodoferax sp.]|uniref:DeoR/GlpR family DNA-binding transcription regulator n=1 Tax=Rhodoferax sp. TaxID=50421 RepID=UPI00374D03C3